MCQVCLWCQVPSFPTLIHGFIFSLCRNINEFDRADNYQKNAHFRSLSTLRCITHALPLSCKDKTILRLIPDKYFHQEWTLDGWNEDIIQPARDAVLNYYTVCITNISNMPKMNLSNFIFFQRYAEPSDVKSYMHHNSLS